MGTRSRLLLALLLLPAFGAFGAIADEGDEAPVAERPALERSWRDQAEAAYRDKDYPEAIYLYRRWLEADPRDENTWYNLACCHALAGNGPAAIDAMEKAVDAGWSDAAWPMQDTDLASVHADPRFLAALARCADRSSDEGPADAIRHHVRISAIGTYLALLPPDYAESEASYPMVVILHGNGSSELGHGRVADEAGREGVIYVVPRAPYPNWGAYLQMERPGWTWRPDATDEELSALEPGPAEMYVGSILAAVTDARKRYRVAGERFYVFGHSMGGFFSNATAGLHPARVAAYFAYAGGLPGDVLGDAQLAAMKEHGVVATHVHGTADAVVPPGLSQEAHDRLTAAGVDSTLHLVEGAGHGIHPEVHALLKRWIRETVRGLESE